MNDLARDKVKHAANVEVTRRQLIKYFIEKGFGESFDRTVNPLIIQDMPMAVFGMDTKLEIEPHAVEVDPTTSRATLGWNLFVLGNRRMYLGETTHDNLLELARQIKTGQIMLESAQTARRCTTPRRIIAFITKIMSESQSGYVDLTPRSRSATVNPKLPRTAALANAQSSQFFQKSSFVP